MTTAPWIDIQDAPVIEQSIHDYIVSIFRYHSYHHGQHPLEITPISPGAEASRGWDAAVREVVPLYFQYKLPDFTSRPKSSQPAIFKQREAWNFQDADGLFHFRLRAKAASAPQSQHELLVDMANKGCRAFYVSPTFVDFRRLRYGGSLINEQAYTHVNIDIWHKGNHHSIVAPQFQDIICIPPTENVDNPPEDHQFFFNDKRQVSLHSDPIRIDALSLESVISDQLSAIMRSESLTSRNVESHVETVLQALAGRDGDQGIIVAIRNYFDSMRERFTEQPSITGNGRENYLMRDMRALSKVIYDLYGVHTLLTLKLGKV